MAAKRIISDLQAQIDGLACIVGGIVKSDPLINVYLYCDHAMTVSDIKIEDNRIYIKTDILNLIVDKISSRYHLSGYILQEYVGDIFDVVYYDGVEFNSINDVMNETYLPRNGINMIVSKDQFNNYTKV